MKNVARSMGGEINGGEIIYNHTKHMVLEFAENVYHCENMSVKNYGTH